ncbi:MAG: GyrI-like domain-containing protein [Cyclobacteriaceae bacterium]
MFSRIEILTPKKLIGHRKTMSLTNDRTRELWRNFMARRKEVQQHFGSELYSIQVYDRQYFENFNPATEFNKWATMEVKDFDTVPDGWATFTLQGGLYAVFLHTGPASSGSKTFQYIFGTWLPNSAYILDNRPHFEILGEKYKHEDPDSQEEIWIPIKRGDIKKTV